MGITIDKVNASVVIIASSVFDMDKDNFIDVWADSSEKTFKLDIGVKKNVEPEDVDKILDFVKIKTSREELKDFIKTTLLFPELKEEETFENAVKEINRELRTKQEEYNISTNKK